MRDRKAAVRFARAFFDDARAREAIDQAAQDLRTLNAIWQQTPDLGELLAHPLVSKDDKRQVCQDYLGPHIQPEQLRFLELLIEKGRAELLPEIAAIFDGLVDDYRGIVRARVKSAVPLTDEELKRLRQAVADLFGAQPIVHATVHPELIGGVTVRVKDTVLDGSVRTSLNVLATDLKAVPLETSDSSDSSTS